MSEAGLTRDEREAVVTAAVAVNGYFPDDLINTAATIVAAREQAAYERGAADVRAAVANLPRQWRSAEDDADDWGPSSAYTGRDCAEMLDDALNEGSADE